MDALPFLNYPDEHFESKNNKLFKSISKNKQSNKKAKNFFKTAKMLKNGENGSNNTTG